MTQSTILAAGITEATSTNIVVAQGAIATVGMFCTLANKPTDFYEVQATRFQVLQVTPGTENVIAWLDYNRPTTVLAGPGTYKVLRLAYVGKPFGVFLEV